ncbi:hypothetical protein LPY66_18470 [Dehalobacter sp. DCM]|uniref:hypothetical protein n=1 Tax=Dehalobacter sp. DCM TaxID=2907827 RepID=UPI003082140C|nr:hypothetical protein LPY66_18470 [Dehalobacter sp. DCM]
MCTYAGCVNMNCERCKAKWMTCPGCGNRAYMEFSKCRACGTELTAEAKEEARALWRLRREESKRIQKEKMAKLKEEEELAKNLKTGETAV